MKIALFTLLIFINFISALSLVLIRHEHRSLFTQLQNLQQYHYQLQEESGKIQLEISTLTQPHLIEEQARQRLNMIIPSPENTQYLMMP